MDMDLAADAVAGRAAPAPPPPPPGPAAALLWGENSAPSWLPSMLAWRVKVGSICTPVSGSTENDWPERPRLTPADCARI